MTNYNDKTVYLGIDVHKKTYAVTAICEGQVIKRDTLKADASCLVSYCNKYFSGAKIETAYEAGFSGFHLHRYLEGHSIKNRIVHVASIEIASNNRIKTDKRDSLRIATQLSVGRLKGNFVPSQEREDARIVTRLRESLVKKRSSVGVQLKALLFQHALIPYNSEQRVSAKWIRNLMSQTFAPGLQFAINKYASLWLELDVHIDDIEKQMASQAQQEEPLERLYRSVPGIGPIAARVLANELGDMSQFRNERQLFSYAGLTPSEHSSGEHIRQGHISRQGKSILRKILVQSAWRAIRSDRNLGKVFDRIAAKAGSKKAIVAVARRLIGKIRACIRTGSLYLSQSNEEEKIESGTLPALSDENSKNGGQAPDPRQNAQAAVSSLKRLGKLGKTIERKQEVK
jgi:transposase